MHTSEDEKIAPVAHEELHPPSVFQKTTDKGLVLVPQPTDDPRDPLNWPISKKCIVLGVITLASYAGTSVSLANAAGLGVQAEVYGTTLLAVSYGISAVTAGLAVGPLVWSPIARVTGRCALIFWGMIALLGTSIWAALSTGEGDYISFIMSRLLAGIFGSVATTVGAGLIVEVFYLHQRGKAFTTYSVMILVGTVVAPTLSGFIVTSAPWPVQYWYNIGLEAFVIICTFFFLEETGFTRPGGPAYPTLPEGFLANRMATFFFTARVVPKQSSRDVLTFAGSQIVIAIAPVTMLSGIFLLITFGWAVAVNNMQAVFLQTPVKFGGYGFTAVQNAEFNFASWIALIVAQLYGYMITDRLPLFICKRWGNNIWKPEYRLHALWVPSLILQPIGLGLFGAALKFHLHYMVLAVAGFFISTAAIVSLPILDTYVVECFTTRSTEANSVMNFYRLVFGVSVPFFITPWIEAVQVNWVFGMMAFFSILAFGLIILLMLKGHAVREYTIGSIGVSEEGTRMTEKVI